MQFHITAKDAKTAVEQALFEAGAGEKVSAMLIGSPSILFQHNAPLTVDVHGLEFEERNTSWSANLLFKDEESVLSAVPASGKYELLVSLPVLNKRMRSGDVITLEDIELVDFPQNRQRANTIEDEFSLVGKSPTRAISPGRPVRDSEIRDPYVITKGSLVTLRYSTNNIEINTLGEAMNNASKGELVRVKNKDSGTEVQAVAVSKGEAQVLKATQLHNHIKGGNHE
jgi:flagella basal body P-ring formation protein FlgA